MQKAIVLFLFSIVFLLSDRLAAQSLEEQFAREGLHLAAYKIDDVGALFQGSYSFLGKAEEPICGHSGVLEFVEQGIGNIFKIWIDDRKVYQLVEWNCDRYLLYVFGLEPVTGVVAATNGRAWTYDDDNKVYRTMDYGATWEVLAHSFHIKKLLFADHTNLLAYAYKNDTWNIAISKDAGENWIFNPINNHMDVSQNFFASSLADN